MKGSCVVCDLRDREKMMAVRRGNGFNRITMVYVLLLVSYTFLKRRLILGVVNIHSVLI